MKPSTLMWPTRLKRILYVGIFVFSLLFFGSVWGLATLIIDQDRAGITFYSSVIRMKRDIYVSIKDDVYKNDPVLLKKLERNKGKYVALRGIVALSIVVGVLYQLKTLLSSFYEETFFYSRNIKCVRRISFLLVIWIITDLLFYISIPLFIPPSATWGATNYIPIKGGSFMGLFALIASINYGVLLSAFAFYVISIVFKEGTELKEETDLTI
jgi:hypothetical protein